MNNDCGVYKITNTKNGRVYIGSSKNVSRRFYLHKWDLNRSKHHSILLQRAWTKYGAENFVFEIVLICSERNLLFYEQALLDFYSSYDPAKGMNISNKAGRASVPWTDERRAKSSAQRMGKKIFDNPVNRANMLAAVKSGADHPMFGKRHRPESLRMMSESRIGIAPWNKGKPSKMKGIPRTKEVTEILTQCARRRRTTKLTLEIAEQIRMRRKAGERQVDLAKEFAVHEDTIYNVVHNYCWISAVAP